MDKHFPQHGLQNTILDNKGHRSYDRLAKDCGGRVTRQGLQILATKAMKEFPAPDNLESIARGLGLPVMEVVRAAAISLGISTWTEPTDTITLEGARSLPGSSQDLIISMYRELRNLHLQARAAEQSAHQRIIDSAFQSDHELAAHEGEPGVCLGGGDTKSRDANDPKRR